MRAFVLDDAVSGHRALYVRVLSEGLLDLGLSVTIGLPEYGFDSQEYDIHLRSLESKVGFRKIPNPGSGGSLGQFVSSIPKIVNEEDANFIYFPCLDRMALTAGTNREVCKSISLIHGEGLLMKSSAAYPSLGWKRKIRGNIADRVRLRLPLKHFHCLDPISTRYLKKKHGHRRDIRLMPEAAESPKSLRKQDCCEHFGLPLNQKYLSCPGTVSERKGVIELVDAIRFLPPEYCLLLAGGHSDVVRRHLREVGSDLLQQNRVVSIDRYVSEEEFNRLFSIADVVCVPYPRHHGSASILIHAAKMKKKVVASDWGWIGWASRTFGIAETCDARDPKSIADAIIRSIQSKPSAECESRKEMFCEYHDRRNHVHHWTAGARQVLGMSPPPVVPFSWEGTEQSFMANR